MPFGGWGWWGSVALRTRFDTYITLLLQVVVVAGISKLQPRDTEWLCVYAEELLIAKIQKLSAPPHRMCVHLEYTLWLL